jgi:hypothetical protein
MGHRDSLVTHNYLTVSATGLHEVTKALREQLNGVISKRERRLLNGLPTALLLSVPWSVWNSLRLAELAGSEFRVENRQ